MYLISPFYTFTGPSQWLFNLHKSESPCQRTTLVTLGFIWLTLLRRSVGEYQNVKKLMMIVDGGWMTEVTIDWLELNATFNSISAVSWHEQILHINFNFYQTLRNKTYLFIKELCRNYGKKYKVNFMNISFLLLQC